MVWNTPEEEAIMGKKRDIHEPGPRVVSAHTPSPMPIPQFARIEIPLVDHDRLMRSFADDLRRLAGQIEFCITRHDLHMTRRLSLIHQETRAINFRWKSEIRDRPRYSQKAAEAEYLRLTKSGEGD